MSIEYIRRTYGIPVKVGQQVRIRWGRFGGLMGKVLRAHGQYVVVKGETWRGHFHPGDIEIQAVRGDATRRSRVSVEIREAS